MFRLFKKTEMDAIEVIIGPQSTFNGVLRSDTSIRIDGAVEGGFVETAANVILTETSYVQCDIVARTVSIRGTYNGTIRADRVELLEGSQAYGLLQVDSFFMDEGSMLNADLIIQGVRQNISPMLGMGYDQPLLEQDGFDSGQLALPQFSLDELSTRLPVDTDLDDLMHANHYSNGMNGTNDANGTNGAYRTNGTGDTYQNLPPLPPSLQPNGLGTSATPSSRFEQANGQIPHHQPTQQPAQPPRSPFAPPPSPSLSPSPSPRQNGPPSSIPTVSPFPISGPPRTPAYQPISLSDLENKANKANHSNNTNSNTTSNKEH